eukprot:Nitzschia sp. Nitz4//scaffold36_size144017//35697//37012//NITZ4_003073-RA/size144017-snap-gene-0.206-mRNA-1//-1//CDS//3329549417//7752//frame0
MTSTGSEIPTAVLQNKGDVSDVSSDDDDNQENLADNNINNNKGMSSNQIPNLAPRQPLVLGPLPLQETNNPNLMLQQQLLLAAAIQQQQQTSFQVQPLYQTPTFALQQAPMNNVPVTHNLIPEHLQATALAAATLNGTPGYPPALIPSCPISPPAPVAPILTVQDRPFVPPVFNGVNVNYPGVKMLHASPPVYVVDNFLSSFECDFLVAAASDAWTPAPVVGKGAGEISPSRTSSTCYLAREDLPDYLRKVSLLTGKPVGHCELPQVGRYLPTQQYMQHFDAFDLSNEDGRRFASNGGQRVITVLVYLNDVPEGGATSFPVLNLQVQPKKGSALVFFPATVDGFLDRNALHAACPAVEPHTKYVSQVWIRQSAYTGQPSKRLSHTLGAPFPDSLGAQTPLLGQS